MAASEPQTARPAVVLVVDDDPAILGSLKFSLEIEGFVVEVYAHAADLVDRLPLPARACLVVDQNLPGESGIDFIAGLRREGVLTPAILITSNPSPHLQERAAGVGLPIVEKPLMGNRLADMIRTQTRDAR